MKYKVKDTLSYTEERCCEALTYYDGGMWPAYKAYLFEKISIAKDKGEPIGWALIDFQGATQVFVRDDYRLLGIGTKLVNLLKDYGNDTAYLYNNPAFFKSVGINDSASHTAFLQTVKGA